MSRWLLLPLVLAVGLQLVGWILRLRQSHAAASEIGGEVALALMVVVVVEIVTLWWAGRGTRRALIDNPDAWLVARVGRPGATVSYRSLILNREGITVLRQSGKPSPGRGTVPWSGVVGAEPARIANNYRVYPGFRVQFESLPPLEVFAIGRINADEAKNQAAVELINQHARRAQ